MKQLGVTSAVQGSGKRRGGNGLLFPRDLRKPLAEVVSVHNRHKLGCGIETKKERLDRLDDLRGVGQIKKDHTAAFALKRRKVGGLWFEFAQYRFHRSSERAVVNRCITLFDWKGEFQHHAHGRLHCDVDGPNLN